MLLKNVKLRNYDVFKQLRLKNVQITLQVNVLKNLKIFYYNLILIGDREVLQNIINSIIVVINY